MKGSGQSAAINRAYKKKQRHQSNNQTMPKAMALYDGLTSSISFIESTYDVVVTGYSDRLAIGRGTDGLHLIIRGVHAIRVNRQGILDLFVVGFVCFV